MHKESGFPVMFAYWTPGLLDDFGKLLMVMADIGHPHTTYHIQH